MTIDEYQEEAARTDRFCGATEKALEIPLLGLAGEVGSLLSEYKKYIRDDGRRDYMLSRISEELGDVFWYATNVATKFGLCLETVLDANLVKARDRWVAPVEDPDPRFFDTSYPQTERLPRWFEAKFTEVVSEKGRQVEVRWGKRRLGNLLTDNAYIDDGYRFHDAFHFGFATMLGWSPVTRRNLDVKRRSKNKTDEVEDGGRAIVFEEAIAALCFEHAKQLQYYDGHHTVDSGLIETIKRLTSDVEVSVRTRLEWENAILRSFAIWRELRDNKGGIVTYDLENRRMAFKIPPKQAQATSRKRRSNGA